MPKTKHDLVSFAKKLRLNLDHELKPSLSIRTCPTPSTSAQLEPINALVVRFLHENNGRKEVFCSYCERRGHKEPQYQKKSCEAKQRKEAKSNTAWAQVATVNESGSGHCQAIDKNSSRWQWLMVVLVGQEVQAFVDIASDLNPIRIDISDHIRLQPFIPERAATQAGSILLKTYLVFHERL